MTQSVEINFHAPKMSQTQTPLMKIFWMLSFM